MTQRLISLVAPLAVLTWLAIVGTVALLALADLTRHPAGQRLITLVIGQPRLWLVLLVPVVIGGGLYVVWRRWPTWYPGVLAALVGVPCLILLMTSGQAIALLAAGWLALVASLIGLTLLDRLSVELGPLTTLVISLALGLGVLSLAALGLGLLGLLTVDWVMVASLAVVVGLARWSRLAIRAWFTAARQSWRTPLVDGWPALVCPLLLAAVALIVWLGVLAPETMFDALMYHLALARIYAESHRVVGLDYSIFSYWPLGGELLFALGYLFGGETAAKVLHLLSGLVATALVAVIGRDLADRMTGLVAATIFATIPVVAWEATTTYVDLLWTMYTAAALALLVVWLATPTRLPLPGLIGAALGCALGIKLTAAFFALGIGLVMLGLAWQQRRRLGRGGLIAPAITTGITLLVALPWYLRAYWLTGNPVFPFLNGLFRSPLWPPEDEWFSFASYGVGTSPTALLSLPWHLTFETKRFGEVDGAAGVLLLAFVPLALVAGRGVVRRPAALAAVGLVCLVFSLGWAFTSQQLRYLLPALAGLAVIAGIGLIGTCRWLVGRVPGLALAPPAMLLLFGLLALPVAAAPYLVASERIPLSVVLGRIARSDYVRQIYPAISAFAHAAATPGRAVRIFPVAEPFQYLSDAPLVLPFFSPAGNRILWAPTIEAVRAELAAADVTHILIDRQHLPPDWRFLVHSAAFLDAHATLQYTENGVELYRLR